MTDHKVASPEEWHAAREKLLVKEKELTRSSPLHGRSADRAGDVNDLADDFGPVTRDRVVGGILRQ